MTGQTKNQLEYRKSGGIAELFSQINILAPPERIWNILLDFQKYPEWNPFIRNIRGNPAEGETIIADIRPSGAGGMTIRPVLLKVNPPGNSVGEAISSFRDCLMGNTYLRSSLLAMIPASLFSMNIFPASFSPFSPSSKRC